MKKLLFGIVIVVTLTLTYVSGQLFFSYRNLAGETKSLQDRLNLLRIDSARLKADIEYFSNPENIEKELRSKFNYKNPGEKLIIGVLQKDSATTTSNQ
jgi:cell division protein FtsB